MSNTNLPAYLKSATPNPAANRSPWFKNTAPAYAGIFLSVPFMAGMLGSLAYGSVMATVVGLVIGALFCFVLYYVPGKLGMTTGMPLYVVASSTFGAQGGILMPGLMMGVLQIGWHAVFTITAAKFIVQALGMEATAIVGSTQFWIICGIWGMAFAFVGAVGIGLLGALSSYLPILPLAAIIIAGLTNMSGISQFKGTMDVVPNVPVFGLAIFAALQTAAGFFATAGAAGADFTMNSRNEKDVVMGGFVGVTLAAIVAGFFAILAMAGAMGNNMEAVIAAGTIGDKVDLFIGSIAQVGSLSKIMFWVFVIACICPTGFCAFLASNAFATMFPSLPRMGMTLVAGAIGVVLAATGKADNLVGFFLIIGASFGPILGAMVADYLRNGKWTGPREGVNWAGYIAWAVGFCVGILNVFNKDWGYGLETLMSFITGLAVYLILAELGFESKKVEMKA